MVVLSQVGVVTKFNWYQVSPYCPGARRFLKGGMNLNCIIYCALLHHIDEYRKNVLPEDWLREENGLFVTGRWHLEITWKLFFHSVICVIRHIYVIMMHRSGMNDNILTFCVGRYTHLNMNCTVSSCSETYQKQIRTVCVKETQTFRSVLSLI
jgi:hypothetical protein